MRPPFSIHRCSEQIYGDREKVFRNRRTIKYFTVDAECEDDTDLHVSVDTDN